LGYYCHVGEPGSDAILGCLKAKNRVRAGRQVTGVQRDSKTCAPNGVHPENKPCRLLRFARSNPC